MEERTEYLRQPVYRRRRVADAARVLPLFGGILVFIPLLWAEGAVRTSSATLYLFAVWAGMIALGAVLSYFLRRSLPEPEGEER
ncbi:MAG: hypothetical protein ACU0DW_15240 [Shimia sp.]